MGTTDPEALRETVADAAEGIVMDANITFVALMHERGYASEQTGVMILEEWIKALEDLIATTRETLAEYRQTGTVVSMGSISTLDQVVHGMIDARREQIRQIDYGEGDECPVCKGPCQGH